MHFVSGVGHGDPPCRHDHDGQKEEVDDARYVKSNHRDHLSLSLSLERGERDSPSKSVQQPATLQKETDTSQARRS